MINHWQTLFTDFDSFTIKNLEINSFLHQMIKEKLFPTRFFTQFEKDIADISKAVSQ